MRYLIQMALALIIIVALGASDQFWCIPIVLLLQLSAGMGD